MKKKSRKAHILLTLFKIFRIKKGIDFDSSVKDLLSNLTMLFGTIAWLTVLASVLSSGFFIDLDYTHIIAPSLYLINLAVFLISFIGSWIFKARRKLATFLSLFCCYPTVFGLVLTSNPLKSSFCTIFIIIMPVITISNFSKTSYFMIFLSIIVLIGSLIYQILITLYVYPIQTFGTAELIHTYVLQFIYVSVVLFFVIFYLVYSNIKLRNLTKKVIFITTAIKNLNFEGEKMESFLETPKELSSEITKLFKIIIKSMIEFRSYLPQGLVTNANGESSTTMGTDTESNSSISSAGSHNHIETKKRHQKITRADYIEGSGVSINYELNSKRGSFMDISIPAFEKDNISYDFAKNVISKYNKWVDIIEEEISKRNGFIIQIKNDHILVAWNIKNVCMDHELKACNSALHIRKRLEKEKELNHFFKSRIIIVTGEAFFGNMGSSKIRTFNFFGSALVNLKKITSFINRNINKKEIGELNESFIVIDQNTKSAVKFQMNLLFINKLSNIMNQEEQSLYLLTSKNNSLKEKATEWMYSIRKHLENEDSKKEKDIYYLSSVCEMNLTLNTQLVKSTMQKIREIAGFDSFEILSKEFVDNL